MNSLSFKFFLLFLFGCFSCLEKPQQEVRKVNSPLLKKVDAVHRQMMQQGNISEDERAAIRGLAKLIEGEGIKSPTDPTSKYYAISFHKADQIPVYQGCENQPIEEQQQCFIDQLNQFINVEFNRAVFEQLGLSGTQQIDVFVYIDKQGYPSALKVQDTFIELQAEALRVLNKIPRMTPASKDNKPVATVYPSIETPYQVIFELD